MKTLIVLLMAIGIADVNAQNILPDVIASSGASHQGTTMQVDWTLGELAITTIQNTSHQVTQGFHQANHMIINTTPVLPLYHVVASAGRSYQATAMQIDWTLGELATTTIQNASQQITQGFHQANYIITNTTPILAPEIGQIQVYPNPTTSRLEIKLNFEQERKVDIQLMDVNGRIIQTYTGNKSQVEGIREIGHLPNGNYFLHFIIDQNQFSQTFKIQKIN